MKEPWRAATLTPGTHSEKRRRAGEDSSELLTGKCLALLLVLLLFKKVKNLSTVLTPQGVMKVICFGSQLVEVKHGNL